MFSYFFHMLERIQHLTGYLYQMLGPPGSPCLTCGTRAVLSSRYPGICPRCVQQIPWIRSIRCHRCGRGVGCPDCVRAHMQNRSFVCNRSAVQYNDLMKDWISLYKFRGHERYATLLTALLIQAFQAMSDELTSIFEKETREPPWRPDAVTYVPVSGERLAERGFNQAERLATGLATAARLPCVDLLQRQINTGKQSFKSRAERFETMKHAFSIKPDGFDFSLLRNYNKPFKLLLIDDIYTTGSTLDACGHVILHAANNVSVPVEIYTLTLARS